ncbi:MAG TPA: extensin family protein [Polyangiaceae bacterium]|nr:extensin family protein [Polyangiaceae bacterium]
MEQCRKELRARRLPAEPTKPHSGIATPLRLTGPLRGVRFISPGKRSVYGVLDCRLVLALDELSRVLAELDVVEVYIDNLYRPRARLPGKKARSQHAYGLAADIMGFKLADGRVLDIERDFHGTIGVPPCGPKSPPVELPSEGVLLREIVCRVAREGVFHHLLTPNFNRAHRNHLHVDIKRDARGYLLR